LPASFAQIPPRLHPTLGPLQKEQASLDTLQRALSDYQTIALRYAQELSDLFEAALSEYQRQLSAGVQPEPSSRTTTRELHDRWIQIAERTYERFLNSEEHTRVIGGLMNAWVDLQLAVRPVTDGILLHMGLPSRRDVDDVQLHLDRLRRQQRADITQLQHEITVLRAELAAWRDDPPDPLLKPRSRRGARS
jgi:class III poly(R)-hydroxyalkanoic acid synthase PhaE subunit